MRVKRHETADVSRLRGNEREQEEIAIGVHKGGRGVAYWVTKADSRWRNEEDAELREGIEGKVKEDRSRECVLLGCSSSKRGERDVLDNE